MTQFSLHIRIRIRIIYTDAEIKSIKKDRQREQTRNYFPKIAVSISQVARINEYKN